MRSQKSHSHLAVARRDNREDTDGCGSRAVRRIRQRNEGWEYDAEGELRPSLAQPTKLDTWARPLIVGQSLPPFYIWLTETLGVSLDLGAAYEQTCRALHGRSVLRP
jgi:hypothetical protein